MLKDALALLAGVTAIQFAPSLPRPAWVYLTVAVCATVATWRSRWRWLTFGLLGLAFALWHAERSLLGLLPPAQSPVVVVAQMQIDSLLRQRDQTVSFDALVLRSVPDVNVHRVRISWFNAPVSLRAVYSCELTLRLRTPRGRRNPGMADAELAWLRDGIDALASVQRGESARCWDTPLRRVPVLSLRERIVRLLDRWAGGHPSIGMLQGLSVGDTSNIPLEQWQAFRATGITHLLAISGSHVGFLGLMAATLAGGLWRWLGVSRSQRGSQVLRAVVAIGASGLYAALAGLSVPTQRTVIMIGAAGLARIAARTVPGIQVLSIALIAVLLWDPTAPTQPGFWLSFGTVAWLFFTQHAHSPWWRAIASQWSTSLVLLPIGIVCFGQSSSIAPLVNGLAVPLTEVLVVPLILSSLAVTPAIPPLGHWLIEQVATALDWALIGLIHLSAWSGAQTWWPPVPLLVISLTVIFLTASHLIGAWSIRALAGLALANLLAWRPPVLRAGEFDFAVLDAGDAVVTVLFTAQHTSVYFAGSELARGAEVADSILLPFLHAARRARVDLLIVSRGDGAHAQGIDGLFRDLPVVEVVGGASTESPCIQGQRWTQDGVELRILSPSTDAAEGQDASCVLAFGNATATALVGGEISATAEAALVRDGRIARPTLVLVPSRGSHHASSPAFVHAAHPRWALISAAFGNRFGYPRVEVMRRWQASGAQVREVSREGAMIWRVRREPAARSPSRIDEGAMTDGERLQHRRYWTLP